MSVLGTDDLLLLNVAVKGHLVEKLSDSISVMQTIREKLAKDVKECLVNVSKTAHACRKCVKDTCEKRAVECKLNTTRLEAFVTEEEVVPIPGVQFLRQPAPVEQGIQGLTQNAKKDILDGVPSNLRGKSEDLLVNTDTKLQTLQERLQDSVHELPGIIPKMHSSINNMDLSSLEDPDILNNMANIAAEQLASAIQQKDVFKQNAGTVIQQLPNVMSNMNQRLQKFQSAVGNFISLANSRLSNIMAGKAAPQVPAQVPAQQWQTANQQYPQQQFIQNNGGSQWTQNGNTWNVQNQMSSGQQQNWPQQNGQQWQTMNSNYWNGQGQDPRYAQQQTSQQGVGGFNSWASNTGRGQVYISQNGAVRRFKRATVKCEDLKLNPENACQEYHFQCPACLNETNIMKHACGNDTLQKMVEIKTMDLLSAKHLMSYHQYIKNGLIVMQVEYDGGSYSQKTKTYEKALITAKIGKEIVTYETSLLPNLRDLKTSGDEIGEEIWQLLQDKKVFDLEIKQSKPTPKQETKNTIGVHKSMELQVDQNLSSAAVVTRAMWTAIGVVVYIGIHAFIM